MEVKGEARRAERATASRPSLSQGTALTTVQVFQDPGPRPKARRARALSLTAAFGREHQVHGQRRRQALQHRRDDREFAKNFEHIEA